MPAPSASRSESGADAGGSSATPPSTTQLAGASGLAQGGSTPNSQDGGSGGTIPGAGQAGAGGATTIAACPAPLNASRANAVLGLAYLAGSENFPEPQRAFDGSKGTDTGSVGNKNGILAVDLGSEKTLYKSVVHFVDGTPQQYKLQLSSDGKTWTDLLRVHNPNVDDERVLPAVATRYLRLVEYQNSATGEDPNILVAISELEVYERDAADRPPGCSPIRYPLPLERTGWLASSDVDSGAQAAISATEQGFVDPHGGIAQSATWLVKVDPQPGSHIAIDMGAPRMFDQVFADSEHDALRDYALYVSDDGVSWGSPVSMGTITSTGGNGYAPFSFPLQTKRFFKLEATATLDHRYWGYKNLSVLDTTGTSALDVGDGVNIALGKPTPGSTATNPAAAFDGNDATTAEDAEVVAVDLGAPYTIARINLKFALAHYFTYRVETSEDGASWTARQFVQMNAIVAHPVVASLSANYTCRYLKFSFGRSGLAGNVSVSQRINEIEVFQSVQPRAVGRESLP